MAVVVTTIPTHPTPTAIKFNVSFSGGGNFGRIWVTDAPIGSAFRDEIDRSAAGRVEVYAGGAASLIDLGVDLGIGNGFTIGGQYCFVAQEYTQGASTYGGGYAGDPNSHTTETKIGVESTFCVEVGSRLEVALGAPQYGFGTLILYVFGDTIRETTIPLYGEKTPRIDTPTTDRARTACEDAAVQTELAALVGQTGQTLVAGLDTVIADMIANFADHMDTNGDHESNDTENADAVRTLQTAPTNVDGITDTVRALRERLVRHMQNVTSLTVIHDITGDGGTPDVKNLPIAAPPGPTDMGAALAALADLYRAFEAHRVDLASHFSADTTSALSASLTSLVLLHQCFLTAMIGTNPTAPTTVSQGVTALIHGGGFRESPA